MYTNFISITFTIQYELHFLDYKNESRINTN